MLSTMLDQLVFDCTSLGSAEKGGCSDLTGDVQDFFADAVAATVSEAAFVDTQYYLDYPFRGIEESSGNCSAIIYDELISQISRGVLSPPGQGEKLLQNCSTRRDVVTKYLEVWRQFVVERGEVHLGLLTTDLDNQYGESVHLPHQMLLEHVYGKVMNRTGGSSDEVSRLYHMMNEEVFNDLRLYYLGKYVPFLKHLLELGYQYEKVLKIMKYSMAYPTLGEISHLGELEDMRIGLEAMGQFINFTLREGPPTSRTCCRG